MDETGGEEAAIGGFIFSTKTDVTFGQRFFETRPGFEEARLGITDLPSSPSLHPPVITKVSPHLVILVYFGSGGRPGQQEEEISDSRKLIAL